MASVKVAARVRPLFRREEQQGASFIVEVNDNTVALTNLKIPEHLAEWDKNRERVRYFMFDYAYLSVDVKSPAYASQELIFQDLGTEVLDAAFEGYNACLFAYGQTGSGKSYTMMGKSMELGLIPRICEGLCSRVDDFLEEGITFKTEVSYLEIYNERVRDLLHARRKHTYTLKVREHPKEGPYVQDLSWHRVSDLAAVQQLIDKGNANRTTAATHMHDASSRSHAIFTLNFTQAKLEDNLPSEIVSKINLVDLAGSERADPRYSKGRLMEGASINKSLVTLGNVISALAENSLSASVSVESISSFGNSDEDASPRNTGRRKNTYIPYRNSVLTWLLKDSLGGNAKTIMIATISPASNYYSETLSTLRYAQRAKHIINKPVINEDCNVTLIRELRAEIDKLKTMLEKANMRGSQMSLLDGDVFEILHKNEEKVELLTSAWVDKWREAAAIMQECNVGIRRSNVGVIVESQLPHLIGMDDDLLSTGIIIYHLKEGETKIGREDARTAQDIVLRGPALAGEHCTIINDNGIVILCPHSKSLCAVNGTDINSPTQLTQGAVILLGKTNMFRFNHPAQAARLRERRNSSLFTVKTSPPVTKVSSPSDDCLNAAVADGALSRNISSSEGSLAPEDIADCRSPVSPIMMFNPQLEIEMQQKAETDRLEETRRKLGELKKEQIEAEEAHAHRQEQMEKSRQQWYDEIERQKQRLDHLKDVSHGAKLKHERELEEMKVDLEKEKDEGKQRLSLELGKLRDLMSGKKTAATAVETQTDVMLSHVLESAHMSIEQLNTMDVGMKRIANIELLQKQSQRKAEEVIKKRRNNYAKQEKSDKERIKSVEKHLKAIEKAQNVHMKKKRQHLHPSDIDTTVMETDLPSAHRRSDYLSRRRHSDYCGKAAPDKEDSAALKSGAKPKRGMRSNTSPSRNARRNSDSSLSQSDNVFSRLYTPPQGTKFHFLQRKNVEYGQVIPWNKPEKGHYTERGHLARKSREDGNLSRQVFPVPNIPGEYQNKHRGPLRPSRGRYKASHAMSRLKGTALSYSMTDIACQTSVTEPELADKAIQRSRSLSPTSFTRDIGIDAMPGFVSSDIQTEPEVNESKKTNHEPSSPLKRSRHSSVPTRQRSSPRKKGRRKSSETSKPHSKVKSRIIKRRPSKGSNRNTTTSGSDDFEVDWHLTNKQKQHFLTESESSSSPRRGRSLEDLGLPFEGFQQRPRGFYESVDSVFDEQHSSQSTDPYPCDSLEGDDGLLDELSEEELDSLDESEPSSKRRRDVTFRHVEYPYPFTNIDGGPLSPPMYEHCESVDSAVGLMGTHEFERGRLFMASPLDEAEILMYRDKDGNIKVGDPRFNSLVDNPANFPLSKKNYRPRSEISADSIEGNEPTSEDSCNTSPRDRVKSDPLYQSTIKPTEGKSLVNQNELADNRREPVYESPSDSRIFVTLPSIDDRSASESHGKGVRPRTERTTGRTTRKKSPSPSRPRVGMEDSQGHSLSYPKQTVEHRADVAVVSNSEGNLDAGDISIPHGKRVESLDSAKMTGSRCTIFDGVHIPRGKDDDIRLLDSEQGLLEHGMDDDDGVAAEDKDDDMIGGTSSQPQVSQPFPGFIPFTPSDIEGLTHSDIELYSSQELSQISNDNRDIPTIIYTDPSAKDTDISKSLECVSQQLDDSEHEQSVSSTMDTDTSVETIIYRPPSEIDTISHAIPDDDIIMEAGDANDQSVIDTESVPDAHELFKEKSSIDSQTLVGSDFAKPLVNAADVSNGHEPVCFVEPNTGSQMKFSEESCLHSVQGTDNYSGNDMDVEMKSKPEELLHMISTAESENITPNSLDDVDHLNLPQLLSSSSPVEEHHESGKTGEEMRSRTPLFTPAADDVSTTIAVPLDNTNISLPPLHPDETVDLSVGVAESSYPREGTSAVTEDVRPSVQSDPEDTTMSDLPHTENDSSDVEMSEQKVASKRLWKPVSGVDTLEGASEQVETFQDEPTDTTEIGLTPPKKKKVPTATLR